MLSRSSNILLSQLKSLTRPMYSNPPIHGAKIVSTILSDEDLFEMWKNDCQTIAKRIIQTETFC